MLNTVPNRRPVFVWGIVAVVAILGLGAGPATAATAPWSPPVPVADGPRAVEASVVAPDGTITAIFETQAGIGTVTSTDAGATWGATVLVGSAGDYAAFRPQIAVSSTGLLAATWVEDIAGIRDVYVATSSDKALTWTAPYVLPNVTDDVDEPMIASSSPDGFTVVWRDNYFNKVASSTTDGGVTWSVGFVITENVNSYGAASVVPVGLDAVVAIFQEFDGNTGEYSIQSRTSFDGGLTWSAKSVVGPAWSGSLGNGLYSIGVSPSAGTVIAAWTRGVGGFSDGLFAATSTDGGLTWGAPIQVFAGGSLRDFAITAVGPTTAGIVWHYNTGDAAAIAYATVDLGATAASAPVSINPVPFAFYDQLPSLATLGNVRVVTWIQDEDDPTQSGLRTAASCDGGATWTAPTELALGADVNLYDAKSVVSGGLFTAFWGTFNEQTDAQSLFASSSDSPCIATAALASTGSGSDSVLGAVLLALAMLGLGVLIVVRRRVVA